MPDQEFLASYAVDIDEDGVSRLQSILESNRSLAEALSSAFLRADGDLSDFARGATASFPALSSFIDAQSRAASTASQASQAIQTLTTSYAGLRSAIPDQPLELSFSGMPSGSGDNGGSTGFSSWLSDTSGSLSRLVALSGGSDAATGEGSGRSSSGSSSPLSRETELSLNLAGASGSSTGGGGNIGGNSGSDGPLARAIRSATGGRFTRPTHVEVAEDGDTEYIIPVDKEPTAVPLLRQALTDLSQSAGTRCWGTILCPAGKPCPMTCPCLPGMKG